MFTLALIQAISDWQLGGYPNTKKKRGLALKLEADKLPDEFKRVAAPCYRQLGLTGFSLMELGTTLKLPESISGWTKSKKVAEEFKNGVPPVGAYTGIIFRLIPPAGSVVLDFTALFAEPAFNAAVADSHSMGLIKGYSDGIGRYGNTQREVVLDLETLPLTALYGFGGHSSSEYKLAELHFGHPPSLSEMKTFRNLSSRTNTKIGPYWLFTRAAVNRVIGKLKYHATRLAPYAKKR